MTTANGSPGANLLVRLSPALGGETVTVPAPADLKFSGVWQPGGGFKAMSCTIQLPWGTTADALAPWSVASVVDRRTGEIVWHGYLTDPGKTVSADGSTWQVSADGAQTLADGYKRAYGLNDRSPDSWGPVADYAGARQSNAQIGMSAHPSDYWGSQYGGGFRDQTSGGQGINGSTSSWEYSHFDDTGASTVERVLFSWQPSMTSTQLRTKLLVFTNTASGDFYIQNWTSTSQFNVSIGQGVGGWPANDHGVFIYIKWENFGGSLTWPSDTTWIVGNILVVHRRYRWDGTDAGAGAAPTLRTADVVDDMVGRGFGALVEYSPVRLTTTIAELIAHAAWWDVASARDVLDFCAIRSPQMWWEVGAPGPSGRPVLTVGAWDGPPRYVIGPGQGRVELSGGAGQIANRALVYYQSGQFQGAKSFGAATVSSTVPLLDDAGVTRTMRLDITSEGLGGGNELASRGQAALAVNARSRTSGTVTISGPILDEVAGRMVEPWELRGGCMVVVADAPIAYSRSTSLATAATDDGAAAFRCTGVEYDAATNSAKLTLDGGSLSLIGRVRDETTVRRYDVGNVATT